MLTWSRQFGVTMNGEKTSALVPLAGMFNQSRIVMTSWQYDEEKNGFTYKANEAIPAGSALFAGYGEKSNQVFFVHYGFVCPTNSDNHVRIGFRMTDDMANFERKSLEAFGSLAQHFNA